MARILMYKDELILRRPVLGHYDEDYNWVDGTYLDCDFLGCVEPVKGGTKRSIPFNGAMVSDYETIVTTQEMRTLDDATGESADRVIYRGDLYEVAAVEIYLGLGQSWNYQAKIVRVQKGLEGGFKDGYSGV